MNQNGRSLLRKKRFWFFYTPLMLLASFLLGQFALYHLEGGLRAAEDKSSYLLSKADRIRVASIKECDGLVTDSKLVSSVVSMIIKGPRSETVLRFPIKYLVPLGFQDGGTREGIVFRVYGYTFKPFTREDANTPEQKKRFKQGYRDSSTILISMVAPNRISNVIENIALSRLKLQYKPGTSLDGPILPNGLIRQTAQLQWGGEIFLGKTDGKVNDVISCSVPGSVPSPSCQHIFNFENMNIKVRYPFYKLDKWRSFRERSVELLSCFRQLAQ